MNKFDKRHIQNRVRYERQIEALFDTAMFDTAKLTYVIGELGDEPFSWNNYPLANTKIKGIIAQLKSNLTASIVNAVRSEWTLSNNKNNELCNQVFGSLANSLPEALSRRYYSTNEQARDAFIARKNRGLNLSDRVWKYTNQFKTEIEMALDIGIRDGKSSAYDIVRDLKEYLKYPDRLYRRVRDEHGFLHLSKKAKAFHPGRGVYRSSYMNARRLAATETNIAYRTADYLRWQQMDFVVGIEIKTSNNHPITDICDTFAGRYPKDFKFTGWHPLCRCHAVTILKTEDELAEDTQRILDGGEPQSGSVNEVTDVPGVFSKWIENNEDRINRAEKRGSLPYFITDNKERVELILHPESHKKTPLESAAEGQEHMKGGHYGAAMKLGATDQKLGQKAYAHAAVTNVSELQKQNIAEVADLLGIHRKEIKPMDFNKADRGMGNVDFGNGDAFSENCPATIAAHEARLRGLNVTALGFDKKESVMVKIRKKFQEIWIDQATGNAPMPKVSGSLRYNKKKKWTLTDEEIIENAENLMQTPGRYHIGINQLNGDGHVIVAERMVNGTLICFDAQEQTFKNLTEWDKYQYIEILKVDELIFNIEILSKIVRKV